MQDRIRMAKEPSEQYGKGVAGPDSRAFQPSFFSKSGSVFSWVFAGFLKRFPGFRMKLEGTPRKIVSSWQLGT